MKAKKCPGWTMDAYGDYYLDPHKLEQELCEAECWIGELEEENATLKKQADKLNKRLGGDRDAAKEIAEAKALAAKVKADAKRLKGLIRQYGEFEKGIERTVNSMTRDADRILKVDVDMGPSVEQGVFA